MRSGGSTNHSVSPCQGAGTATDVLAAKVYGELRALAAFYMHRESPGHTLPPTALAHEVFIRMAAQDGRLWSDRSHFLAIASRMIRRILVDHARNRRALKRDHGPFAPSGVIDQCEDSRGEVLRRVDEALTELAEVHERQARVVELRYFGGLSIEETAGVLGVSVGTVNGDWRVARAWLADRLT